MRTELALLKNAIDIHVHSSTDLYRRIEDFAATIRRLGPQNVLISSDCGQLHNPPVEEGFTEHEIRTLVHENAAKLLYE